MLVPTLQRWCQAHGTCARLAAPMPSCSAGARLTAPAPCPQEQDQAGTIHVALISPVSHSQHRCHTGNTCTGSQHPHRSSNAWISLTAPIPGSLRTFSRCGPPVPCSQHLCQPHSPFGRLTPPTPSSQHPSHTHSTHPTLMEQMPGSQSPSQDCTICARLTAPMSCSQHPWQAHSTHTMLCIAQGSLTTPIPSPQHPSHTHGAHARLTGSLPGLYHLYDSARAMLAAPTAASQQPQQSHDTYTSPTIPTQVP